MKKFLTLVLALVLVFGLTVPAMAFTSDDTNDDSIPYDLSIYLVEYTNDDLFGIATYPESDRGYAKNEIVAAVVELYVPKNENPYTDGYGSLEVTGDNVKFGVSDNDFDVKTPTTAPDFDWLTDATHPEDGVGIATIGATDLAGKNTFKWLIFAKVTDDDASLTVKLVDGTIGDEFEDDSDDIEMTLDGVVYNIAKDFTPGDGGTYTITVGLPASGDYNGQQIIIYVDKNYKSKGMEIDLDGTVATLDPVALGVNTSGELGWVDGAVLKTSGTTYEDVMDLYEDVVVDVFGMDYFLIGHYVRDSYFEDLTSGDTLTATVDIEPWTAYVTVPDNIVVDPPKTGDAASIMGFVMVALSGAGAVALKKRG